MKYHSKNIIAIFIAIILLTISIVTYLPPSKLHAQNLEQDLEQIQKEREETQEKIKEVKKQEQEYTQQVEVVEEQLLGALSQLDELNMKLGEAKTQIDKTTIELVLKEQELKDIEKELESKVQVLNDRVASIYKNRNINILEILLKAENFIEFISRLKLMNTLAEKDTDIITGIKDKKQATLSVKKSILDLREKQREHKQEVESLVSQAEAKKSEIEGIYNEKNTLLSETRANKDALIRMERQLEQKESEVKRILESYRYGSAPGGRLAWPVAGRLTSGFGYRVHPIFGTRRFHSGIDIAAPHGTQVKAADGGQIVQAGYFGGYGYSIMVYHGGGYATWYAHLSSFNVSTGQMVERGQVIGYVGSTGWTTGPHLHFEVRINGNPQNPLGHL
ncbi:MAG: murein hydrolase activator EnvC family protein [Actinomycetota bacterium]